MKRSILSLCLIFSTIATLHSEEVYVPNWGDGPHIGVVTGDDVENDAFAYGWQAEYHANPWFALEMAVSLHEDEISPEILSSLGTPVGAAVDLDIVALALTGKINLWETDHFLFHAGAGFGYYLFNNDVDTVDEAIDQSGASSPVVDFDADIHKEFGYHFSVGATAHLSRKWDVFVDGRYTLLDSDVTYTVVRRNPGSGALVDQRIDDELDYNHFLVRFGVNYRF